MHGLPLAPSKPHSLFKTTELIMLPVTTLETTFPYSRLLPAHRLTEMTVATAVGTTGPGNGCKPTPSFRLCTIHSLRVLASQAHALRLKSLMQPLLSLQPSPLVPHTFKFLTTRQTPSGTPQTSNPPLWSNPHQLLSGQINQSSSNIPLESSRLTVVPELTTLF